MVLGRCRSTDLAMSPKTSNLGTNAWVFRDRFVSKKLGSVGYFTQIYKPFPGTFQQLGCSGKLGLLGWIHGGRIISAEDSPTYTKWGRYLGVRKTVPRISLLGCCRKLG